MSSATAQCLLSFLLLGAVLLATPSLADDELPPKPAPGPGQHHRGRPCFRPRWGPGHPPGMPPFPEPVIGEGGLPPVGHPHALPPFFGPGRGRGHGPKFDPKNPHPPHAGGLPPIPSWFGKGPHGPPFHGGEDDDDCFHHFGGAPAHGPDHPHHPPAGDHHKHRGDKKHPMPPASAPK